MQGSSCVMCVSCPSGYIISLSVSFSLSLSLSTYISLPLSGLNIPHLVLLRGPICAPHNGVNI
jgi:hypothetical protein